MHPTTRSNSSRTGQYQVQEEPKINEPLKMKAEELRQASLGSQIFVLASSLEKEPYMTSDLLVRLIAWKAKYSGFFDNLAAPGEGFKASSALAFLYTDVIAPMIAKNDVEELIDYKIKLIALMRPILPRGLTIERLFEADNKTDMMIQKMAVTSNTLFTLEDQFRIQCQEMKDENQKYVNVIKETLHTNIVIYRDSVADLGKEQEKVLTSLTANVDELINLDKQSIALSDQLIQEDRHIQSTILKLEQELSRIKK